MQSNIYRYLTISLYVYLYLYNNDRSIYVQLKCYHAFFVETFVFSCFFFLISFSVAFNICVHGLNFDFLFTLHFETELNFTLFYFLKNSENSSHNFSCSIYFAFSLFIVYVQFAEKLNLPSKTHKNYL